MPDSGESFCFVSFRVERAIVTTPLVVLVVEASFVSTTSVTLRLPPHSSLSPCEM